MRHLPSLMPLIAVVAVIASPSSEALANSRTLPVVCGVDRLWLTKTVLSTRYELAGVNVALERSATPAVRQLAATVERDNLVLLSESRDFLRGFRLSAPTKMDPVQHWSLHMVSQEAGAAFDRDYAWLEVANHVVDIRDAADEMRQGCNTSVRNLARNSLPYLRLHLRLASTWRTGPKG
jgi:predicted outer membrane protein